MAGIVSVVTTVGAVAVGVVEVVVETVVAAGWYARPRPVRKTKTGTTARKSRAVVEVEISSPSM